MKIILSNEEREHYKRVAEYKGTLTGSYCNFTDCEHCQIDELTDNLCDNEKTIARFILNNEVKSDS